MSLQDEQCECRCVKCGLRAPCRGYYPDDVALCTWLLGGAFAHPTPYGLARLAEAGPEHADPDGHRGEGKCA